MQRKCHFLSPRFLTFLHFLQERVINPDDLKRWFDELYILFEKNHYNPAFIFNFDETMLSLKTDGKYFVVCKRNTRPVIEAPNEKDEHMTLGTVQDHSSSFTMALTNETVHSSRWDPSW